MLQISILVTNALRDINIKYITYIEYLSGGQGFNKTELLRLQAAAFNLVTRRQNERPQPLNHPSGNVSASSEHDPKGFLVP